MRFLVIPALGAACAVSGLAQTVDRVYTADQTSNTVSVIDPATNKFLGSIHLGDDVSSPIPYSFSSIAPFDRLPEIANTVIGPATNKQAPFAQPDMPISSHDRVYTADQFSNTVSVVDPSSDSTLGVIRLGNPSPNNFSPL